MRTPLDYVRGRLDGDLPEPPREPGPLDDFATAQALRDLVAAGQVSQRDSIVLEAIAVGLTSIAFQADRYDTEILALRGEIAELRGETEGLRTALRAAGVLHSVKV